MRYWARLVGVAALTAYASWAIAADLVGTVRNEKGRLAPGVEIILKGVETDNQDFARQIKTTNKGEFVFFNIPPGAYNLICGTKQPIKVQVRAGINRRNCS
jgi:hypothetical protein